MDFVPQADININGDRTYLFLQIAILTQQSAGNPEGPSEDDQRAQVVALQSP